MTQLNPDGSVPGESPSATERRRLWEQRLDHLGVGSDAGQRHLEAYGQELNQQRHNTRERTASDNDDRANQPTNNRRRTNVTDETTTTDEPVKVKRTRIKVDDEPMLDAQGNELKWCGGVPSQGVERHVEPKTSFAKNGGAKDGLQFRCRACHLIANKATKATKATKAPATDDGPDGPKATPAPKPTRKRASKKTAEAEAEVPAEA
jgi:hypothetical protein